SESLSAFVTQRQKYARRCSRTIGKLSQKPCAPRIQTESGWRRRFPRLTWMISLRLRWRTALKGQGSVAPVVAVALLSSVGRNGKKSWSAPYANKTAQNCWTGKFLARVWL